jgi:hypothetical protein
LSDTMTGVQRQRLQLVQQIMHAHLRRLAVRAARPW